MPYLRKSQKEVFEVNCKLFRALEIFLNVHLKAKPSMRGGKPSINLRICYSDYPFITFVYISVSDFDSYLTEELLFQRLSYCLHFEGGQSFPVFVRFFEDFVRFYNRKSLYDTLKSNLPEKRDKKERIKI